MYKTLMVLVFGLSVSALAANERISNELATVKACAQHGTDVPLDKVTEVSVNETPVRLTVEMKWKREKTECTAWSWFSPSGEAILCEDCDAQRDDGSLCACASLMCVSEDGTSTVVKHRSATRAP